MRKTKVQHFLILLGIIISLFIGAYLAITLKDLGLPTKQVTQITDNNQPVTTPERNIELVQEPAFNKSELSNTNPNSIWVVANKQHPLSPINYTPEDLTTSYGATIRSVAQSHFENLMYAANNQNIGLTIVSSYRSYWSQTSIYNNYVSEYGQELTDTFSARPGYSEHQTGLTIDFGSTSNPNCNLDVCFADTAEGQWLTANSKNFGFILRYPYGKTSSTGYKYEPWHYRYVGTDLAAEINKQPNQTLEEFFNISGGEFYL